MIGYMGLYWFSYLLFENCRSQLVLSFHAMLYEVETSISDSSCQVKLIGDIAKLILYFVSERFLGV